MNSNIVSFAYALLNEAVIKPTAQGIIDDIKKGLEEDFEIIYKPKGLEACKAFVDNKKIKTGFDYLNIFTPTLQKLLKNEFLSLKDLAQYNTKILESNDSFDYEIIHTVFYKSEKNKYGLDDDIFINCTFINDKLLKI